MPAPARAHVRETLPPVPRLVPVRLAEPVAVDRPRALPAQRVRDGGGATRDDSGLLVPVVLIDHGVQCPNAHDSRPQQHRATQHQAPVSGVWRVSAGSSQSPWYLAAHSSHGSVSSDDEPGSDDVDG